MSDIFYLDAPSMIYRAFFALPTTIKAPDGRSVNAVRGFMEMVTRLIVDRRPDRVVAVHDADWRPKFRVDAYPGYKAARPEDPPELPPQFDIAKEVVGAAGLEWVEAPDLEADDAIATLVATKPPDERAVVVTGDRDLLALVRDPDVSLLFPVKGMGNLQEFDEAAVEDKYGVPPALYPEFAMLRGDGSDGLPGVSGIGPVRAVKLLRDHGSIAGIFEHLDDLPPKQTQAFNDAREYLEAMRTVVPLVRDAPLEVTQPGPADPERLKQLAVDYNLGSSATRLAQAIVGER